MNVIFEFGGENDGKEIVRNDFGRIVEVIPYIFNRASVVLERMVFRESGFVEK